MFVEILQPLARVWGLGYASGFVARMLVCLRRGDDVKTAQLLGRVGGYL